MLNVVKEQKGNVLVVHLNGSIEESVDFQKLIGKPSAELHVNCKGVPRINSVGVKGWITYFQGVTAGGTKLKLFECSTAIVEQINLISNFPCGGDVVSIYVPFSCEACHTELVGLFQTEALKKLNFQVPDLKCTKCGGKASFDDIPEEFFNFMMEGA